MRNHRPDGTMAAASRASPRQGATMDGRRKAENTSARRMGQASKATISSWTRGALLARRGWLLLLLLLPPPAQPKTAGLPRAAEFLPLLRRPDATRPWDGLGGGSAGDASPCRAIITALPRPRALCTTGRAPDHDMPATDRLTGASEEDLQGPDAENVVSAQREGGCGLRLSSSSSGGSNSSRGAAFAPPGLAWHHRIGACPSHPGEGSARAPMAVLSQIHVVGGGGGGAHAASGRWQMQTGSQPRRTRTSAGAT